MSEWSHPAWPCLAGALLVGVLPRPAGRVVGPLAAALAVALAWVLPDGGRLGGAIMGQELVWARVDALTRVFAIVFAMIGGLGTLYGLAAGTRRVHVAGLVACGSTLGVVLAGDWITLYVFWETLAVASFVVIGDGGSGPARAAAFRYLLVHAAGGTCLLAGIAWHLAAGGGTEVTGLPLQGPGTLILLAFAVNAAIPPLHAWLTDAYPESSPTGSVLLSAFVTKAAVYALVRVFPGHELLVWAGVTMALYGVVFAVLENDIRRLLAYHIVSQVGYMVTGVGLGTPLGVSGAAAHAFSHILYKALLFMGAGAVVQATGRRKLTELGGLARAMPGTLTLYMIGAFSISGAPLLNGFVSKSIIVAAAEAAHRPLVVWLLNLASVGTFLSVALKLPYFTFGGGDRGIAVRSVPASMSVAMVATAALCVVTGVVPSTLYRLLPFPVAWEPYTPDHVLGALELLAGTAIAFVLLRRHLGGKPTVTLDTDRIYRAVGRWVVDRPAPTIARAADILEARADALVGLPMGRRQVVSRWPIGYAVLVVLVAFGLALLLLAPAR